MVDQILIDCQDPIGCLKDYMDGLKVSRVLLVTGKRSFKDSGAEKTIREIINPATVELRRFSDFSNNPFIEDLKKGILIAEEFRPQLIIGIGGGSVLDMAKLLRFFFAYAYDGDLLSSGYVRKEPVVPLIAIPTTAGPGSEATHFAVVYDNDGIKHSISHQDILPNIAVLIPDLTFNLNKYITACSGFDAFAQAVESYWNVNATEESDGYALSAMEELWRALPLVVAHPTPELRDTMLRGAHWAGKAINITKTTAPHAFSYPFTSHYGIPHGHAVALTFPWIAEFNFCMGSIPSRKKEVICNLFSTNCENIASTLYELIKSIGLGSPDGDLDINLLSNEINLERLSNNPATFLREDILDILHRSTRDTGVGAQD